MRNNTFPRDESIYDKRVQNMFYVNLITPKSKKRNIKYPFNLFSILFNELKT